MDRQYNGWTNKPTWTVHLWLSNDAATDAAARRLVCAATQEGGEAGDALRAWVEDVLLPDNADGVDGLRMDLLAWVLAWVDWQEVASAFAAD
jgi:hypothetical protein